LESKALVGQVHKRDPGARAGRVEPNGVPAESTEGGEHLHLGSVEVLPRQVGDNLELNDASVDEDRRVDGVRPHETTNDIEDPAFPRDGRLNTDCVISLHRAAVVLPIRTGGCARGAGHGWRYFEEF